MHIGTEPKQLHSTFVRNPPLIISNNRVVLPALSQFRLDGERINRTAGRAGGPVAIRFHGALCAAITAALCDLSISPVGFCLSTLYRF